jgi:hypothetical protein
VGAELLYKLQCVETVTHVSLFSSEGVPVRQNAVHLEGAWRSGSTDPHLPDLGTSWRWVVSFTPRPLYLRGKSPRYPLDRRLGGYQNLSERRGEERIPDFNGTRTPTVRSSSPQPVAIPTELSRLLEGVPVRYSLDMRTLRHIPDTTLHTVRIVAIVSECYHNSVWVRFPAVLRDFSSLHSFRTGSGAHPASYPTGTGGSFPGNKAAGA